MVTEGKSNKEIAAELVVAVSTVRTHLKQAYKKLNVRTRMQAIVKVRDLDLVVDDDSFTQVPESATATCTSCDRSRSPSRRAKRGC